MRLTDHPFSPADPRPYRVSAIETLRRRLSGAAPQRVRGDHDLNPGCEPVSGPGGSPADGRPAPLCEAAVLVPIIDREEGATVLLTQRNAHLAAHAGQISFPGGRREDGDESPEDNALRETTEEIGLGRAQVEVLGRLDTYVVRTGYRVTPVVGVIRPPLDLLADPAEVAEIFEVPLDFILAPHSLERHSREMSGRKGYFYAFPYRQRFIWGATAGILVNLREVLGAAP